MTDVLTAATSTPSSRASSRKNRVYVFREFLLKTYQDYLRPGDVVLDVAGGKGDLSWLLTNVDGLHSVIVDPRPSSCKHILRSVSYLRAHPKEQAERSIPGLATNQPLASLIPRLPSDNALLQTPQHVQLLVDEALVQAVKHYLETERIDAWKEFWADATLRAARTQGAVVQEATAAISQSQQTVDAEHFLTRILLKLRLIVGFHPDQGTEALMDLAVLLDIPFCTVPCCVFPSEFPDRRLPYSIDDSREPSKGELQRVRTHAEFMVYLKHKFAAVSPEEGALGFWFTETAKNRVLWTRPTTRTTETISELRSPAKSDGGG